MTTRHQHPQGSGRRTADAINRSLTGDPLLLLHTEQLHRVDTHQLPMHRGVALGHCRTDRAPSPPPEHGAPRQAPHQTPHQAPPSPPPAPQPRGGCTQDCAQGDWCTCAPGRVDEACPAWRMPAAPAAGVAPPVLRRARGLLARLGSGVAEACVALLVGAAMAVFGPPQDH